MFTLEVVYKISIHAPLRERQLHPKQGCKLYDFNPRSLTGANGRYTPLARAM